MPNQAAGQGTTGNPATVGANQFRATLTDANQQQTVFELNALHQVIAQTDALTRTTTMARDAAGNPTSITRPNGAVTTMTYDAQRNLLTSTETLTTSPLVTATTAFTYEPVFNQVTRITDPKGNQTNITYDAQGNPLTITVNAVVRFSGSVVVKRVGQT